MNNTLVYRLERKYKDMLNVLNSRAPFRPDTALILGSGLGGFADSLKIHHTILSSELPGYPASTVEGHLGRIHFAESGDKKLLLFQGRIHFYEGIPLESCLMPVFIARSAGARNLILTNAAGGISPFLQPGDLMLNTSMIAVNIKKELTDLIGIADYSSVMAFRDFPSAALSCVIEDAARECGIELKHGVYWYCKGPSYETPAEIRMINKLGGDAVGMSTVYEAIFSALMGLRTASVSCITNYAAGISEFRLSHDEVQQTADKVKDAFERLIKTTIARL